jgi:hypothetical protein
VIEKVYRVDTVSCGDLPEIGSDHRGIVEEAEVLKN